MKTILKGRRFHISDINMNVTANINAALLNTVNDSFAQFSERSKKKIWCRDIAWKKRKTIFLFHVGLFLQTRTELHYSATQNICACVVPSCYSWLLDHITQVVCWHKNVFWISEQDDGHKPIFNLESLTIPRQNTHSRFYLHQNSGCPTVNIYITQPSLNMIRTRYSGSVADSELR
jgi:hypothetical protein